MRATFASTEFTVQQSTRLNCPPFINKIHSEMRTCIETILSHGISRDMEMKTGHLLDAYDAFQELTGISIPFTDEQTSLLEKSQRVILMKEQLEQILTSIASSEGMQEFLESHVDRIPPVVMSLYVMNDALWKMMERNPWDKTTMLAMSTIPYCFWDQNEESATNPKAVKRWENKASFMQVGTSPLILTLGGEGGDFSGFMERSQLTMRRFGMIDGRGLVPNYQYKTLRVDVELDEAEIELHPPPFDTLDYDFSEKAQTFHEHGFLIKANGKQVKLAIENKESTMRGDVFLLVGLPVEAADITFRGPLVDIWLWAFSKMI